MISRHHGDLRRFQDYLKVLAEEEGSDIIEVLNRGTDIGWREEFTLSAGRIKRQIESFDKYTAALKKEESIGIYAYVRVLYSMLVAADYYATSQYMTGAEIYGSGDIGEWEEWIEIYEKTDLLKKIRNMQKEKYPHRETELKNEREIGRAHV